MFICIKIANFNIFLNSYLHRENTKNDLIDVKFQLPVKGLRNKLRNAMKKKENFNYISNWFEWSQNWRPKCHRKRKTLFL